MTIFLKALHACASISNIHLGTAMALCWGRWEPSALGRQIQLLTSTRALSDALKGTIWEETEVYPSLFDFGVGVGQGVKCAGSVCTKSNI